MRKGSNGVNSGKQKIYEKDVNLGLVGAKKGCECNFRILIL